MNNIGWWLQAVGAVMTTVGFLVSPKDNIIKSINNTFISVKSENQQGGITAGVINGPVSITYGENSFPEDPVRKAYEVVGSLKAGLDSSFFEEQLKLVAKKYTVKDWRDPTSNPPITYHEKVFKGYLSSTPSEKQAYYIQVITQNDDSVVIFWSITVCDPSITFPVTDPQTGNIITINQSSFADIFPPKPIISQYPNRLADTLYYSTNAISSSIFETEGRNGALNRIYAGVNNSCVDFTNELYFRFKKDDGSYIPSPQFLQNVSNDPDLIKFRNNTSINMIGFGRQDAGLYFYFTQVPSSQGSVGYNIRNSPDGPY